MGDHFKAIRPGFCQSLEGDVGGGQQDKQAARDLFLVFIKFMTANCTVVWISFHVSDVKDFSHLRYPDVTALCTVSRINNFVIYG